MNFLNYLETITKIHKKEKQKANKRKLQGL